MYHAKITSVQVLDTRDASKTYHQATVSDLPVLFDSGTGNTSGWAVGDSFWGAGSLGLFEAPVYGAWFRHIVSQVALV